MEAIQVETRSGVRLRCAEVGDVNALQNFGRDAFARTFGHCYPPEELESFLLGPAYDINTFLCWITDAENHYICIAIEEQDSASGICEKVVGYSLSSRQCHLPHQDVTPNCFELVRLYVAPSEFGKGTAHALMDEALRWMNAKRRKCEGETVAGGIWLGVFSENYRAQKFYAKFGFEVVGEYEYIVGRCRDREFIMRMREPMPSVHVAPTSVNI
jgi:ribosomal protein S18 acetylase RimI-like enzyme